MRLGRCAAVAVAMGLAVSALTWSAASPLAAARSGTATFDQLVALAAAVLALGLLVWVAIVLAVTALAALPVALGGTSARLAERIAPGIAGRLARLALGLTLTAGPLSACSPAMAGSGKPPEVVAESVTGTGLPSVGRIGEEITPSADDSAAEAAASTAGTGTAGTGHAGTGHAEVEPAGETSPADHDPPGEPATSQPATTEPSPTPTAGLTAEPSREHLPAGEVVVKRGDTLWAITARHLGPAATEPAVAAEWPRWYAANRAVIGDDPDLIFPGTILHPPADRPATREE